MNRKTTLEDLSPGTSGKILALNATGNLGQRLLDLGFYPGVEFRVIRNAPLKDPFELEIMGYLISLRHKEAGFVEVKTL